MNLTSILIAAALANGVPPDLQLAVCWVESNHRPVINHRDGKSASIGQCQVKLHTARQFAPNITADQLMEPKTNAEISARYLKYLLGRYGGKPGCASIAYNRGSVSSYARPDSRYFISDCTPNRYSRKVQRAMKERPWLAKN